MLELVVEKETWDPRVGIVFVSFALLGERECFMCSSGIYLWFPKNVEEVIVLFSLQTS